MLIKIFIYHSFLFILITIGIAKFIPSLICDEQNSYGNYLNKTPDTDFQSYCTWYDSSIDFSFYYQRNYWFNTSGYKDNRVLRFKKSIAIDTTKQRMVNYFYGATTRALYPYSASPIFLQTSSSIYTLAANVNTIDTDNDGVLDSNDIDDDNDGILDIVECENILKNSGFNNITGLSNGNNIGIDITPWVLGMGNQANIVKVDGAGGFNYGNSGPYKDANAYTGEGEDQYYLDIVDGSNDFYQSFTINTALDISFGGYFSARDDLSGNAEISIYQGDLGSLGGSLVATTGEFSIQSVNNNVTIEPWTKLSLNVPLPAGTYSFVVAMDSEINFDEAFLRFCGDTDNDNIPNHLDIDSDNDGIPDNVEAQPTIGYVPPSGTENGIIDQDNDGLDDNYDKNADDISEEQSIGLLPENTDRTGAPDFLDSDTDEDTIPDIRENGLSNTISNPFTDDDNDGLDNVFDITLGFNVNNTINNPDIDLPDCDADVYTGGDVDYRDIIINQLELSVTLVSEQFNGTQTAIAIVTGGNGVYEYQLDNGAWTANNIFSNLTGCNEYTIKVREINSCAIFEAAEMFLVLDYPKFFTPNGDGFNETWNIKCLENQPLSQIFIYNRFGKLLMKIVPNSLGWDGTFNGAPMTSSDYWFSVDYVESDGDARTFKSHFTLKR